jgi:hypothetical protein
MFEPLDITEDTNVIIGAPSKPMDPLITTALGELAGSVEGIVEAHLPQCFILGVMDKPAQILVVLIDPIVEREVVLQQIEEGLKKILPGGYSLDVWAMDKETSFLNSVRGTNCQIAGSLSRS